MPAPASPAAPAAVSLLDDASLQHLSRGLRGVETARVRFYGATPDYEGEIIALLMALDISVESEQLTRIAPAPRQRFSLQFKGRHATLTVAPALPLRA